MTASLVGAAFIGTGCEEESSSSGDGGLSGLAENPTSMYGRSAATGRDLARQIEGVDRQREAMADEMSGQTSAVVRVAGLSWRLPSGWESQPPANRMRAAQATTPGGGEIVFSHFGSQGQGGSAEANIQRWSGQMQDLTGQPVQPQLDDRLFAGLDITLVSMEGTFMSGMPMGPKTPKPGYAFRGAIVEGGPQGTVFLKWVGPEDAVFNDEASWETLIESVRKE